MVAPQPAAPSAIAFLITIGAGDSVPMLPLPRVPHHITVLRDICHTSQSRDETYTFLVLYAIIVLLLYVLVIVLASIFTRISIATYIYKYIITI